MRFLLLLGLVLLVVWLFRGGRRVSRSDTAVPPPSPPSASQEMSSEEMVVCQHCGVHLPQGEAVSGAAGWFCCAAHRDVRDGEPPG